MAEMLESATMEVDNITQKKQAASNTMKDRFAHGDEWESYVADKFEEMGIQPINETHNDGFGDRIADYRYEDNWIEAKTFINQAETFKIIQLNKSLKEIDIQMSVCCEWSAGNKKYKKLVKQLRDDNIWVFEGQSEVDSFIINEGVTLNKNKEIKMARPLRVHFNRVIPHPNNRDLNIKNVPIIKVSITKHGYFTQLNVVPVGPETKQKMWDDGNVPEGITEQQWFDEDWYQIFEGHTRYYALLELVQKGYHFEDMMVSAVLVDWITSDDIDKLHKMLIKTNTSYEGWKLKNFVKSHKGNLETLGETDGVESYGKILKAMNQAKKGKWGETTPVYVFAHKSDLNFNNMKSIKDGSFRITDDEFETEIEPLFNMMSELSSTNFSFGGRMRYILVNMRVLYHTNDDIRRIYGNFIKWATIKFKSDIKNENFPITSDETKKYWKTILEEFQSVQLLFKQK